MEQNFNKGYECKVLHSNEEWGSLYIHMGVLQKISRRSMINYKLGTTNNQNY
jgi:hypothetical protein